MGARITISSAIVPRSRYARRGVPRTGQACLRVRSVSSHSSSASNSSIGPVAVRATVSFRPGTREMVSPVTVNDTMPSGLL